MIRPAFTIATKHRPPSRLEILKFPRAHFGKRRLPDFVGVWHLPDFVGVWHSFACDEEPADAAVAGVASSGILDKAAIQCMIPCMATKTISLELDAYEKLRRAKREGESFSGVVRRARFGPADACGRSILTVLDEMAVRNSDEEAARRWEESGRGERMTSPPAWEGGNAS